MNGRVYDPLIGRFMSADPFIQSPGNLQSYNRYAYVMNNPLAYTDPSGYLSFRSLIRSVIAVFAPAIAILPPKVASLAYNFASVVFCGPSAPVCAGAAQTAISYYHGASTSDALKSGARAGATAWLFQQAGEVGRPDSYARYAAHAGAGCVSSAASGGNCGQGAASAVFGKYTTNSISGWGGDGTSGVIARGVATAVAGGVGSVIAGGKFANGAETAAFGYLFNELAHQTTKAQRGYGATFYPDDHMVCDTTCWTDKPLEGSYPVEELVAGGGAAKLAGAGLKSLGPVVQEALGPAGSIFGRTKLGGSSVLNINANDALRIGWGWKGGAQTGTDVFRISGDWVRAIGVKSGHIDLFTLTPK